MDGSSVDLHAGGSSVRAPVYHHRDLLNHDLIDAMHDDRGRVGATKSARRLAQIAAAMSKLGARNRVELVIWAHERRKLAG